MALHPNTPLIERSGFLLSLVTLLLILVWLIVYIAWPKPFWTMQDDYAYLALAHALNLESRLRDGVYYGDEGLLGHPGIPFYFVSWLCLRAAALFAGAQDAIAYGLERPQGFLFATRVAAGAIAMTAVAATWRILHPLPPLWRTVAVGAFFAAGPESFYYGLTFLGNETFALPLAALLFLALKRIVAVPPEHIGPWLILGAVSALGYAVKVLYLDVLAAAWAVACVDAWWYHRHSSAVFIVESVKRVVAVSVAFVGVLAPLLLAVLGEEGFDYLMSFHWRVFTRAAHYGSGDASFVALSNIAQAVSHFIHENPVMPLLVLPAIALLAAMLVTQLRRGAMDRKNLLWCTAALTALLVTLAAVFKHFATHYLPAVSALLPFVMAIVLTRRSMPLRRAAAVVTVLCLVVTLNRVYDHFERNTRLLALIAQDERAISAMPLAPGEARLWTYNVAGEHMAKGFIAHSSGVSSIAARLKDPQGVELSSFAGIDRPYRYVVLDKNYFPTTEAVRLTQGSLEPTQSLNVKLNPDDQLHEFNRVIVVERRTQ